MATAEDYPSSFQRSITFSKTAIVTRGAIWSSPVRTYHKGWYREFKVDFQHLHPSSQVLQELVSIFNRTSSDSLILYGIQTDRYKRKKNGRLNHRIWPLYTQLGYPTRVPPNAEPSLPDVSLASTSLITSCSCQTLSTLIPDPLPILIRLQMKTTTTPGLRRTYANLKKANWDWDRYRQEVEAALSKRSIPADNQRDELIFRAVLLKTAPHHIPTGRHRLHEEPVPADILDVMTRLDDLRKSDPHLAWTAKTELWHPVPHLRTQNEEK